MLLQSVVNTFLGNMGSSFHVDTTCRKRVWGGVEMASIIEATGEAFAPYTVLVGASINLVWSMHFSLLRILTADSPFVVNKKHLVDDVRYIPPTPSINGGGVTPAYFLVMIPGHQPLRIPANDYLELVAGSSLNLAIGLKGLGVPWVDLTGPLGQGTGKNSVLPFLREAGLERFIFTGKGTSKTLSLIDAEGQATLFCGKKSYDIEGLEERFASVENDTVVFSGVKPQDLPLVEAVWSSPHPQHHVLLPHESLCGDPMSRVRLNRLLAKCWYVQFNKRECNVYLGRQADEPITGEVMTQLLAATGAKMVVVTVRTDGVWFVSQSQTPIHIPAWPMAEGMKRVDTEGSGDRVAAAMIYYLLKGLSSTVCLKMAMYLAHCKVMSLGGWAGMPSLEERERVLAELVAMDERENPRIFRA